MKIHWQWRLTHKKNKEDSMTFRTDKRFRDMLTALTQQGVADEYDRVRVMVLR